MQLVLVVINLKSWFINPLWEEHDHAPRRASHWPLDTAIGGAQWELYVTQDCSWLHDSIPSILPQSNTIYHSDRKILHTCS